MITQGIGDRRQLAVQDDKERVEKIVESCLTTPYDKELLTCVKRRRALNTCRLEFADRERRHNIPRDSH